MSTATVSHPGRRRQTQLAIGVALVVLAFVGVLAFGRISQSPASKVTVVGAAHDIKTGHAVTLDDLDTVDLDALPTGALRDRNLAVGKIARQDIKAGDAVLDSELAAPATPAAAKLYFTLPAGKVALNIPSGDISPYVQPGDQIDIIATPRPAPTTGNQPQSQAVQTKTTLKGLKVLSVGTPGTPSAGNLVVQVSLQDAELLQFLLKNTDFTYVLKSPLDADTTDPNTTGVDMGTFRSTFGYK